MVRRHNNQLPENLPQLQNLIKRDPISYHEEFCQQHQHFKNVIEIFELSPEQPNKLLDELTMFMAQIAHCYPKELSDLPQTIITLLEKHNIILDSSVRLQFCRALILLRTKNLLTPTDLLELFFKLLRCHDKALRTFLQSHIISDIKNMNIKHKNAKLNASLQNFMFTMLKDTNSKAAKMSVNIMIELYNKNIWNDVKTVNVIASGCFSQITKVMVAALKFFLGKDPEDTLEDSSSEDEVNPKEIMMANKVNKKTRKRAKNLNKIKKLVVKTQKKKSSAPVFNFSALHLIHDPQGMVEKLFKQLETTTKRFEVRLLTLDVISRLIGLHNLFLFNFYPYIQRFIQPHQREVIRILQFAAQASHELVPPDILEPIVRTIANNFITERNSADVMAIGLNATREICARCPLAMEEDLLKDLAAYKTYRERPVMMAARSLIQLFRTIRPELLNKRDRGKPTDATLEMSEKRYAQIDAKDYISGAEVLLKCNDKKIEIDSSSDSNDEEWVDIPQSDDEFTKMCGDDEQVSQERNDSISNNDDDDDNKNERKFLIAKRSCNEKDVRKELAKKISLDRILTDDDFKKIDAANIRKHIQKATKGEKRKFEEALKEPSELVKIGDIENVYKKKKHDKKTRMESVRKGQMDREKYGYKDGRVNPKCSSTNKEKRKTKNFQMIRLKERYKTKKSFKEKQVALRNYLVKQRRMK